MTCAEALSGMSAYYDGELPLAERSRIASHLADCPACRAYLRDLARIGELLRGDGTCEVPEGMWARILTAARHTAAPRRSPALRWTGRAAALAAGFLLYWLGFGAVAPWLEPQGARHVAGAPQIERVLRETGVVLAGNGLLTGPSNPLDQRPEAILLGQLMKDAEP